MYDAVQIKGNYQHATKTRTQTECALKLRNSD